MPSGYILGVRNHRPSKKFSSSFYSNWRAVNYLNDEHLCFSYTVMTGEMCPIWWKIFVGSDRITVSYHFQRNVLSV